ncbi:MAG: hypothetical protein E6X17_04335 [Sporomusaceae bacterium]|nr:hypothetical protein [Sporomusaceae bacterium]
MPEGMLTLLLVLAVGAVAVYKRQWLLKQFTFNMASETEGFRAQVEATANQAVKRLEEQMAQLEYLLAEADDKIVQLGSQLQQSEQALQNLRAAAAGNAAMAAGQNSGNLPTAAAPVETPPLRTEPVGPVAQEKRQQIMRLYQEGKSIVDIARATSMGTGEVMLILELHKTH